MNARTLSLIVILGFLMTTAGADSSDLRCEEVTVAELLEMATSSYEEGSLEEALQQLEMAQAMIVVEIDECLLPEPPPVRSNAVQLLVFLDFYRMFVLGSNPELDEAWSDMTDLLVTIADLESFPDPPREIRGMRVHTWTDGRVHRIGDVRIGHWADGQINHLGDYRVSYWANGSPIQIGGIRYGYDAGEQMPSKVGGARID